MPWYAAKESLRCLPFEGQTDPADEAILYAISSDNHAIKGMLVSGYGIYTEGVTDELLAKLRFDEQ